VQNNRNATGLRVGAHFLTQLAAGPSAISGSTISRSGRRSQIRSSASAALENVTTSNPSGVNSERTNSTESTSSSTHTIVALAGHQTRVFAGSPPDTFTPPGRPSSRKPLKCAVKSVYLPAAGDIAFQGLVHETVPYGRLPEIIFLISTI
jgi:hypothetical protein